MLAKVRDVGEGPSWLGQGGGLQRKRQKEAEREGLRSRSQQEGQAGNRIPCVPGVQKGQKQSQRHTDIRCSDVSCTILCPRGWGTQANEGQRQRRIPVFTGSTGLPCLSPGKTWVTLGELPAPASSASPARWGPLRGLRMEKICPICLGLGLCQGLQQFQGDATLPASQKDEKQTS